MIPSGEHPEEAILDLYVLNAPEVDGQRGEIAAHLDQCASCAKICADLTEYYAQVEVVQQEEATGIYPSLQAADRIIPRPFHDEMPAVRPAKRPVLQVFVTSIKAYPVRWTGAFVAVIAALVLLVPKIGKTNVNPEFVRARDEFLIVLNGQGQELWRTFVGPGFDMGSTNVSISSLVTVADVDGDGGNEILFTPPVPQSLSTSFSYQTIVCYNADGAVRWRFAFHPTMTFGGKTFTGAYDLETPITVGDFNGDRKVEVVVAGHHDTWWPSFVVRLNAFDGAILSEYWNPGWIKSLPTNVEKSGIDGILVAGYSNAFERSSLAVLDSRFTTSHAPATSSYRPDSLKSGTERYYILLPNPDIYKGTSPWAAGSGVHIVSKGLIEVRSARIVPEAKSGEWQGVILYFYFDQQLRCVDVKAGDDFKKYHLGREKTGELARTLDTKYFEDLKSGVQYWDGEKFVNEVTMNKRYSEIKNEKGK